eukprot:ctg_2770.g520
MGCEVRAPGLRSTRPTATKSSGAGGGPERHPSVNLVASLTGYPHIAHDHPASLLGRSLLIGRSARPAVTRRGDIRRADEHRQTAAAAVQQRRTPVPTGYATAGARPTGRAPGARGSIAARSSSDCLAGRDVVVGNLAAGSLAKVDGGRNARVVRGVAARTPAGHHLLHAGTGVRVGVSVLLHDAAFSHAGRREGVCQLPMDSRPGVGAGGAADYRRGVGPLPQSHWPTTAVPVGRPALYGAGAVERGRGTSAGAHAVRRCRARRDTSRGAGGVHRWLLDYRSVQQCHPGVEPHTGGRPGGARAAGAGRGTDGVLAVGGQSARFLCGRQSVAVFVDSARVQRDHLGVHYCHRGAHSQLRGDLAGRAGDAAGRIALGVVDGGFASAGRHAAPGVVGVSCAVLLLHRFLLVPDQRQRVVRRERVSRPRQVQHRHGHPVAGDADVVGDDPVPVTVCGVARHLLGIAAVAGSVPVAGDAGGARAGGRAAGAAGGGDPCGHRLSVGGHAEHSVRHRGARDRRTGPRPLSGHSEHRHCGAADVGGGADGGGVEDRRRRLYGGVCGGRYRRADGQRVRRRGDGGSDICRAACGAGAAAAAETTGFHNLRTDECGARAALGVRPARGVRTPPPHASHSVQRGHLAACPAAQHLLPRYVDDDGATDSPRQLQRRPTASTQHQRCRGRHSGESGHRGHPAAARCAGRGHHTGERGVVAAPFAKSPRRRPEILCSNAFTSDARAPHGHGDAAAAA